MVIKAFIVNNVPKFMKLNQCIKLNIRDNYNIDLNRCLWYDSMIDDCNNNR